jgi:hypothetical protein
MTEFEALVTQELRSLSRAAWTIAWLIVIYCSLFWVSSMSSRSNYEGEELDAHYAVDYGPR